MLDDWYMVNKKRITTLSEVIPSTIWPTRRSIIEGMGSPLSSALVAPLFSTGFFAFGSFSFFWVDFSEGAEVACFFGGLASAAGLAGCAAGVLEVEAGAASVALAFFFGGSAFLSILGILSRSNGTTVNSGARPSAAFRTSARCWMWSK